MLFWLKSLSLADELTMVSLNDWKLLLGQAFGDWHSSVRPANYRLVLISSHMLESYFYLEFHKVSRAITQKTRGPDLMVSQLSDLSIENVLFFSHQYLVYFGWIDEIYHDEISNDEISKMITIHLVSSWFQWYMDSMIVEFTVFEVFQWGQSIQKWVWEVSVLRTCKKTSVSQHWVCSRQALCPLRWTFSPIKYWI